MNDEPYKKFAVSRPKDRSLKAYKAWMMEIAEQLTTEKIGIKWTEEEWIAKWKKFWQKGPSG